MSGQPSGPATALAHHPLQLVRILGLPLDVLAQAQERQADLMREFTLLAQSHPDSKHEIPARLVAISNTLRERFSSFTAQPTAEMDAARARGDASIDLEYWLPAAAADAAAELEGLLDEADDYCRRGDLLTLAAPPESVVFRRWYLREFVRQIAGQAPTPWPEYTPGQGDSTPGSG